MSYVYEYCDLEVSEGVAEQLFYVFGEEKGWVREELVITWDNRHDPEFRDTVQEMTNQLLMLIPKDL